MKLIKWTIFLDPQYVEWHYKVKYQNKFKIYEAFDFFISDKYSYKTFYFIPMLVNTETKDQSSMIDFHDIWITAG